MKPSPESLRRLSIVRRLEAQNAPQQAIDVAYDTYWDSIDRDRAQAQRLNKRYEEQISREAEESRRP